MRVGFYGGVGTVTGSKHLVEAGGHRILLDCGMFQGFKHLRLLNRRKPPFDPASLDAVVLSHAHIDHSGYLPALVRDGFRGPIWCTEGTAALCGVLLPDAAYLQEEEAERANRKGYAKHTPALPLFTVEDAERALAQLRPVPFDHPFAIGGAEVVLHPAGHILGASIVRVAHGGRSLVFTGDLGRASDPVMLDPTVIARADYLLVESTYGNRTHGVHDPERALAAVISRTLARGGIVVCPAFAVGRTQRLLFHLWRLQEAKKIPRVPVYLNSPLALEATTVFRNHVGLHQLDDATTEAVCRMPRICRTADDSRALNARHEPAIIIAGSGMVTGGRVLHHVVAFGPSKKNTILLTGFQAAGTRGAALVAGAERLKMFGSYVHINAEVVQLSGFSAHADQAELLDWMRAFERPPRKTFIVHGEPDAADALRLAVEEQLGWRVTVPILGDVEELGAA